LQLLRGQQVQDPRGWLAAALAGRAELAAGALGGRARPGIGSERVEGVPRGAQRRAGVAGLLAAASR
jgi:hypothetical protein